MVCWIFKFDYDSSDSRSISNLTLALWNKKQAYSYLSLAWWDNFSRKQEQVKDRLQSTGESTVWQNSSKSWFRLLELRYLIIQFDTHMTLDKTRDTVCTTRLTHYDFTKKLGTGNRIFVPHQFDEKRKTSVAVCCRKGDRSVLTNRYFRALVWPEWLRTDTYYYYYYQDLRC